MTCEDIDVCTHKQVVQQLYAVWIIQIRVASPRVILGLWLVLFSCILFIDQLFSTALNIVFVFVWVCNCTTWGKQLQSILDFPGS